jgi:hypothetical protein
MPSEEDLEDENLITYQQVLEMEEYKEKFTK